MGKQTQRKGAKVKKAQLETLRELIAEHLKRNGVIESLQSGGGMPEVDERNACSQDWTAVLATELADLMEQLRYDESDPLVNAAIRKDLAAIIATCEAWDKQLTAEDAQ